MTTDDDEETDRAMRKVAQAGDDIIEVLKAQNLSMRESIAALGSVVVGILKSEDDKGMATMHAMRFCLIILMEIDAKGFIEKAEETAQKSPNSARIMAMLKKMAQETHG